MLVHLENATIHPMQIATVEDRESGCFVTLTNGEVLELTISRIDFNSRWLEALGWWSVKPLPTQSHSPEMQALIDRTARRTKGE